MWALFRLERRQVWTRRRLWIAGGIVLLVVAVQVAITLPLTLGFSRASGSRSLFVWVYEVVGSLGLTSPLAGLAGAWGEPVVARSYAVVEACLAIPAAASHFLRPAYAAAAIAPDRQTGRLSELAATRLTPGQILLGKGLALLLPFAALLLAGWALACAGYALTAHAAPAARTEHANLAAYYRSATVWALVATVPGFLSTCALLVCASALCRKANTALAVCYAVEFVGIPLLAWAAYLASAALSALHGDHGFPSPMAQSLLQLALRLLVILFLLRPALRAVRWPDG